MMMLLKWKKIHSLSMNRKDSQENVTNIPSSSPQSTHPSSSSISKTLAVCCLANASSTATADAYCFFINDNNDTTLPFTLVRSAWMDVCVDRGQ